jgi:hypothetical protein
MIKSELLKITKEKHKTGMYYDFSNTISIHVRLGDFTTPDSLNLLTDANNHRQYNYRIPLGWYINVVEKIRKCLDKNITVNIFSDGSNEELKPLLELGNCRRLSFGSSISDILALSRSRILVASGSTFSMWASYLGRMPVVWFRGQLRQKLYHDNPELEIEHDGSSPLPKEFVRKIVNRGV